MALGTDGIGGNVLEAFRLAYVLQRSVDVTCGPGHGLVVAGDRLGPGARGARRRGHLVLRPDGPLARRLHARDPAAAGSTIDGEVVFADGRPTRVDADEIRAKAREQAARLHARL